MPPPHQFGPEREVLGLRVNLSNGQSVEAPIQIWVSCLIQSLPPDQFEALLRNVQAAQRSPSLILANKTMSQLGGG